MKFRDAIMLATLGVGLISAAAFATAQEPEVPPVSPPPAAPAEALPEATPVPPSAAPAQSGDKIPGRAAALPGVITPKFQPQSVTVTLLNGSTMSGTIGEVDQWQMKTSLGTTNVPVSAVAGVRMAQEGNSTTTIVLHNGDSITGALQLDTVAIQTDWGRAEIYGTHVTSIMFVPGLKWTSETGLSGTRWKLVTDESRTPPSTPTPAPAASTAAKPAASTNGQPVPVRPASAPAPPRSLGPFRGSRP